MATEQDIDVAARAMLTEWPVSVGSPPTLAHARRMAGAAFRAAEDQFKNVGMTTTQELTALCFVPDCSRVGTVPVQQRVDVEWESGRQLEGHILHRGLLCEPHFEALIKGKDVP